MKKNYLIRKIRLIIKFMISQLVERTMIIHILPNISRIKSKQTMKFGTLTKYYIGNIFLEKSYTKCSG